MGKTYRYRILEEKLTRMIGEERYAPHDLLPSYAEIREKWGYSIATVIRAFDSMEKKGLIYSLHGKGTFVSPPVRSRKILILYPGDGFYRESALFLDGAQKYLYRSHSPYLPVLLPLNFVLEQPDNLTYTYPDVRGIIVFRDFPAFQTLVRLFGDRGVSLLFYGSSWHNPAREYNSYLYREEEMAALILKTLEDRGYDRAGAVLFEDSGLGAYRYELFRETARERGMGLSEDSLYRGPSREKDFLPWLLGLPREGLPLYAPMGHHLVILYRHLLRAGLSLPDDLGLIGIDRTEFSSLEEGQPACLPIPTARDGENCVRLLIEIIEKRRERISASSPLLIDPGRTLRSVVNPPQKG